MLYEGLSPTVLSDFQHLCRDKSLMQYLFENEYVVHPCEKFTELYSVRKQCKELQSFVPCPTERHQLVVGGSFTGAASLVDIVHHAHAGFAGRLTKNPGNNGRFR